MSNTSDKIDDDVDPPGESRRDPVIESALKGLRDEAPSVDSRRTLFAALGLDQPAAALAEPTFDKGAKAQSSASFAKWAAIGVALGTLAVFALRMIGYW
jgi:hypothetical protein